MYFTPETLLNHVFEDLRKPKAPNMVDKEAFCVCLFSLSLTGAVFVWYAALPPNYIYSWGYLERKFPEHFFSKEYELELVNLAAL
jgi:hypothetical protein